MNNRDDLEEILRTTYERRAQVLEQQLDRRLSRLWRTPERRPARWLLRPALALASLAVLFLGAWLYDLSQSRGAGPAVLDRRFERPQLVLRQPGDPVLLTRQVAGVQEQDRFPPTAEMTAIRIRDSLSEGRSVSDQQGNHFVIEQSSRIVKQTPQGETSVVIEGLDNASSLAFDSDGNLFVLESGKGRILRLEPVEGEIKAGSPVSVLAEGFGSPAVPIEDRAARMMREEPSHLGLELKPEERAEPVYLTVNERGEIFVGGKLDGEAVVYKIGRRSWKWWKFYCFYQC